MSSWPEISWGRGRKLGPSTCRFCRKCISVNALRTDVCFEDAWGLSMGLRRTGLGLRSHWRLCLRGTAKEFVRLRCCYSPKVWAGVDPECGDFAGDERGATSSRS